MGLFSDDDDYEWHATYKQSWWDGSVLTWCGACKKAKAKAGK